MYTICAISIVRSQNNEMKIVQMTASISVVYYGSQ